MRKPLMMFGAVASTVALLSALAPAPGAEAFANSCFTDQWPSIRRVYNPYTGLHHYTADCNEYGDLIATGWTDEGILAGAGPVDAPPVYRLYNPYSGQHLWTLQPHERDGLRDMGWTYEGVAWHTNPDGTTPVYRLYNPHTGEHLYTTNMDEYDSLPSHGWVQENVAWTA